MKKFWNHLNMTSKLILVFSMVSVIPLITISLVLYYISSQSLQLAMEETSTVLSSQIASNMNTFVEDYDALTKSFLVNKDLLDNLSTDIPISERISNKLYYREMITELMTRESKIQSITIMNNNQEHYQYDRTGKILNYEALISQDWFKKQQKTDETLFITPLHDSAYYDRNRDEIIVTFGRKVYDYNGQYAGLILIDLSPTSIIKLSDAFLLERNKNNIKINITDAGGGLIYDSDLSSGRINYSEIDEEKILMYQKEPKDYLVIEETTEQLGMKIRTVIPHSKMFLRIAFIQRITIVLVMVLIVIIIVSSTLFSRKIVYLIRRLQASMKQLEEGSYELITDPVGKDEIGSLVKSYNHMVKKMQLLIEEVYIAGIRQKNAQFLALKTQINPHFLFNTLESIRIKAILNGDDEVSEMVKLLAKMFRNILDSDKENYKVQDEMENVRAYIKLQNIRFDDFITLQEEISPKISNAKIMPLLFQPVVENSFKYGSKESFVPIRISIKGKINSSQVMVFEIHDNGQGMRPERLEKVRAEINQGLSNDLIEHKVALNEEQDDSNRIGLKNIAHRLRLRYGNEGELNILSSSEHGTVVEIRVPYRG